MGLGGGLVKKVFSNSKTRSSAAGSYAHQERHNGVEKCIWRLAKLKFCGDDLELALEEEDNFAYAATLPKPGNQEPETTFNYVIHQGPQTTFHDKIHECGDLSWTKETKVENISHFELSEEENAAIVIQSAFRGFLARRQCRKSTEGEEMEVSSRISMGTSVEVHMGDSARNFKIQEDIVPIQHKVQPKARQQTTNLKLQEWDDSTVSSNELKLRIQNRREATTRRERALAYASSRQLRICSDKGRSTQCDPSGTNIGWTWLDRWMATRVPESSPIDDGLKRNIELITSNKRSPFFRKQFDLALEENVHCGSNDVSVGFVTPSQTSTIVNLPTKNPLKSQKAESRRNALANHHYMKPRDKVADKDHSGEADKDHSREADKEKRRERRQPKIKQDDIVGSKQDQLDTFVK